MTYDTNDRLKFTLQKEKRLPMIEEWDEYAQQQQRGPLRGHRSCSNL